MRGTCWRLAAIALAATLALPQAASANRGGRGGPDSVSAQAPVAAKPAAKVEAGLAAIDAGAYEKAIGLFEKVIADDPESAEAFNQLGYIHRRLQNFDQAFAYYKRALEIDPDYAPAHHYIGEAYLETGNLEMAEHHLQRLDLICLFGCDDFDALQQAVALYRKNNGG